MTGITDFPPPIPGLLLAGLLLDAICAILCWVFVWKYRRISKTREGRHLYRLSRNLGIIFTLTVAFAWLPQLAFQLGGMRALIAMIFSAAVVQIIVLVFMAAELTVRIQLLDANQRVKDGTADDADHELLEASTLPDVPEPNRDAS